MAVSYEIEFKVDREKLEWLIDFAYLKTNKIENAIEAVFPNVLEAMNQPVHRFLAEMSDEDLIKVFNAIKL